MFHSLQNPSITIPSKPHSNKLRFYPPIRIRNRSNNKVHSRSLIVTVRSEMDDGYYMRRCVELARTAIGHTAPNPMVGCVIVNGKGEVVGEGFHPKAGQPHAEVFALRNAGNLAENATAYVSLEPCNHYGRTPPCTEALIKAKVKRVVVGMVDPNPIVASKGVEKLRASGIDVTVGIEEMLCQKLNEAYIHRMLTGKPFVTLRYTISFKGNIVNQLGEGSEELGGYYSQLLQEYDGIISSSNDLSLPTSGELGASQPIQIIIAEGKSSSLSLPKSYIDASSRVIIFVEKPINVEPKFEGLEVVVLEKLRLSSILDYCGKQGLCSIVIDIKGGDGGVVELLDDGLSENLVQKVIVELCTTSSNAERFSNLTFGRNSLRLKDLKSRVSNSSVIVEGYIS